MTTRTLNQDASTTVGALNTTGNLNVAGTITSTGGTSSPSQNVTGLLEVSGGLSVKKNVNNLGFSPFAVESTTTITASRALTNADCGVVILAGSTITLTLPAAANAVGSQFIIRKTDTNQHVVSASSDVGKTLTGYVAQSITQVSASSVIVLTQQLGSRATFDAVANSSLLLCCDGVSWCATPISGNFVVAG